MMAGTASFQASGGTRPGRLGRISTTRMAALTVATSPSASMSRKNTVHSDTSAVTPPRSHLRRRSSSRLS